MNAPEVGEGKVVCLLRVALHYNIYIYICAPPDGPDQMINDHMLCENAVDLCFGWGVLGHKLGLAYICGGYVFRLHLSLSAQYVRFD